MKKLFTSSLVCQRFAHHGGRLVYAAGAPGAPSGGAPAPTGQPTSADEEAEQREKKERSKREKQGAIERATFLDPFTKQLMREALASDSLERQNLVDLVLDGELSVDNFEGEYRQVEKEDSSWATIFSTQRQIRTKIRDLQIEAEGYHEIIPYQKKQFESILKDLRNVNRRDDTHDRALRRQLMPLLNGDTKRSIPAGTLSQTAVNEIYSLSPVFDLDWEKKLQKYQADITAVPGGAFIFKKIIALKLEEKRHEAEFIRLKSRVNRIVESSVSAVKVQAEKEYVCATASAAIGITIADGTTIAYDSVTLKIDRVEVPTIVVRDKAGHPVNKEAGVPIIHLSNGQEMTIGRFKKWVDGVNAVEKIESASALADVCNLTPYGDKIVPGMELYCPRRRRKQDGEIETIATYVRVMSVDSAIPGGRITFSEPVVFQPGFHPFDEYEMRSTLSFGEFAKWWHRYEIEKSTSLDELRDKLLIFNEIENKKFGIEAKDNPSIIVDQDEMLVFPDASDHVFTITGVRPDGVNIDAIGFMTFPEFFYWVKNNHVRKLPPKEKSTAEKELQAAHAKKILDERDGKEKSEQRKIEEALHQSEHAVKHMEHIAAGSPIERIKQIWWTTQFLSFRDLFNMGHEVVEFVKRKHERLSKGRFGTVGRRLPGVLGSEFDRIRQEAENAEVGKYKEAMEHWGIPDIQKTLATTNNPDLAKACINTLVHKGEMRWDDHNFWNTLNRLTARYTTRGAALYIPHPEHMPSGMSGEDMARDAIDALWGVGNAAEWYMESTGKYNSNKNNFEWKFKQLENDPKGTGGLKAECETMLKKWKNGEYVNAQEYESMIDNAVKAGKLSAEAKVFFIFSGVLARQGDTPEHPNHHGETLLHIDRLGELNSKYSSAFPLLDFFTGVRKIDERTGKKRKLNLQDYVEMKDKYFKKSFDKNEAGADFAKFLWENMLTTDAVRTRVTKGIRNAENMDHDDSHLYIPLTSSGEIDSVTTGPSGNKKYFTNEGYMNGYAGFNQWLVALSYAIDEDADPEKKEKDMIALQDAVVSFVRYDAILDDRLHKEKGTQYARLDNTHYRKSCVVDDSVPLRVHQEQLRNLILEIGAAYGQDWASWLYGAKTGSIYDKNELAKQKQYEARLESLKEMIPRLVQEDKGRKLLGVIHRARDRAPDGKNGLRGIKDSARPAAKLAA